MAPTPLARACGRGAVGSSGRSSSQQPRQSPYLWLSPHSAQGLVRNEAPDGPCGQSQAPSSPPRLSIPLSSLSWRWVRSPVPCGCSIVIVLGEGGANLWHPNRVCSVLNWRSRRGHRAGREVGRERTRHLGLLGAFVWVQSSAHAAPDPSPHPLQPRVTTEKPLAQPVGPSAFGGLGFKGIYGLFLGSHILLD